MPDHYFTPDPEAASHPRTIDVVLRGHPLQVRTDAATFSPFRLDKGTRVLLDAVPDPPASGRALDLGCGWGPLALALALAAPALEVWAVDVNHRALSLAEANATAAGCAHVQAATPDAVPEGLRFDVIWSNPPIRIGKRALDALLRTWLMRLAPGGEAWLVVAKNLGADSLLARLPHLVGDGFAARRATTSGGFRVLHVERAA